MRNKHWAQRQERDAQKTFENSTKNHDLGRRLFRLSPLIVT